MSTPGRAVPDVVPVLLADGLYRVEMPAWAAGFAVDGGRVRRVDCAPILWRRLASRWVRYASRVPCSTSRPRRVLVTGSRSWTTTRTIRDALAAVWGDGTAVLVSGACRTGADALAEQCWRAWGGEIDPWPADWRRYGRAAGPIRNAAMVDAGADVCVAFIRDGSAGASGAAQLAERAGIPTRRYTEP